LIGNSGVGKSCSEKERFIKNIYSEESTAATVGAEFGFQSVKINDTYIKL